MKSKIVIFLIILAFFSFPLIAQNSEGISEINKQLNIFGEYELKSSSQNSEDLILIVNSPDLGYELTNSLLILFDSLEYIENRYSMLTDLQFKQITLTIETVDERNQLEPKKFDKAEFIELINEEDSQFNLIQFLTLKASEE